MENKNQILKEIRKIVDANPSINEFEIKRGINFFSYTKKLKFGNAVLEWMDHDLTDEIELKGVVDGKIVVEVILKPTEYNSIGYGYGLGRYCGD